MMLELVYTGKSLELATYGKPIPAKQSIFQAVLTRKC